MGPQPAKTRGDSPFQSPPKPMNTTFATLKGQLSNMTPKDLRDLLSKLGVNIEIKEEGGDNFPDANKHKDEASRDYYQQKTCLPIPILTTSTLNPKV
jgi:hypothetical protein